MQAFARSAAKPEGTSSNDFLEAILREREDLREKINNGEMIAYVPQYGKGEHKVIIADKNFEHAEIFKGPRVADNAFNRFFGEADWLEKLGGRGLPVPKVTCRGKESLFFGMEYLTDPLLDSVLDEMTQEQLQVLATDVVNFLIGMANSAPRDNLFPHHRDLHERNVLVDKHTKRLVAVLDFGVYVDGGKGVEYVPKVALAQTGLGKDRTLPGSPEKNALMQMIREKYALRKDEVSDLTHELDSYYLVRVYHEDADPFAVLTDLRENLADICTIARPEVVRSLAEDGYDYMAERKEVEDWLREGARAGGVDIRKETPVYFVLTRDPEAFANNYRRQRGSGVSDRKAIIIPASEMDLSACSFTYDDSFPGHKVSQGIPLRGGLEPHPLSGIIFNARQMAEALKIHGEPKTDVPSGFRYIEVQMWDKPSVTALPVAKIIQPVKPANGHGARP